MGAAERQGFSIERLGRIDRFLQDRYLDAGRLPCAQVLIARRGEVVHEAVLGRRDVERGIALTSDTVFRIYSMTKPVTSVALMALVEEGRVALDDPVSRHLPEFADAGVFQAGHVGAWTTVQPARAMQVVDLLRHTSGLTYSFHYRNNVDAAHRRLGLENIHGERDLAGMVAELSTLPLIFSPGSAWNYSVATDVLGYLVQLISGQPFDQFLKERIFDPLKMVDTGFFVPEGQRHRFTACYTLNPKGEVVLQDDPATSRYFSDPSVKSGGGGLVSTADDYMRFCRMLLNGGELDGARIVSPKTLKLMTLNHLPGGRELTEMSRSLFSETVFEGLGFGLGFAMTVDQARTRNLGSLGEYFWGGMASTAFWIDPVEDLAVVFMTQLIPSSAYPIRRELRTLVYAALTESNA